MTPGTYCGFSVKSVRNITLLDRTLITHSTVSLTHQDKFIDILSGCPQGSEILSCSHPCLQEHSRLSEVSKNTAYTSHMRQILARNNQCFHSAWLSALWSPKHSLYPHSAATQGNIHLPWPKSPARDFLSQGMGGQAGFLQLTYGVIALLISISTDL